MKRWLLLGVLSAALPAVGCSALHPARPAMALVNPLVAGEPKPAADLPPEQAAAACVATAQALEKKGHEPEAIMEYERARQYNARLAVATRRLAVLYDRQGETSRAQAEYQRALEAAPKDADLLNDIGYFHYTRGQWAEAEESFRAALEVNPGHARAWGNLGLVYGQQQRFEDSLAAFSKALGKAEAYSNVGVLLAKQGRTEEARAALQQALRLQPDLKPARAVLAWMDKAPAATASASPASEEAETEEFHVPRLLTAH